MNESQTMVRLLAPDGCNEIAHGEQSYAVRDGVALVPESIVATLLRSHGFTLAREVIAPEQRKILHIGKRK